MGTHLFVGRRSAPFTSSTAISRKSKTCSVFAPLLESSVAVAIIQFGQREGSWGTSLRASADNWEHSMNNAGKRRNYVSRKGHTATNNFLRMTLLRPRAIERPVMLRKKGTSWSLCNVGKLSLCRRKERG